MMSTRSIIVASTNPVKVSATRIGFAALFPDQPLDIKGVAAPSGVSAQPMGEDETLRGARNRVAHVRQTEPDVDYIVGLEGGIVQNAGDLLAFAWIVIQSGDHEGRAKTAAFLIPRRVADLVRSGMELGHADDQVFGKHNSKQQSGSVGLLTNDIITRTTLYAPAVTMALIPFINPNLDF